MSQAESLTLDLSIPQGACCICRRELSEEEHRLDFTARIDDTLASVTICRFCISEHAPELLKELEAAE